MGKIDKFFEKYTGGLDSVYWMNNIGEAIGRSAKPIKGHPGLSTCDPGDWLDEIIKELSKRVTDLLDESRDENIAVAWVLGTLLMLWSVRIIRAKSYDLRRPVKQRREMMGRFKQTAELLAEILADESMDAKYFPGQTWDPPFSPDARHEPDEMELKRQKYNKRK